MEIEIHIDTYLAQSMEIHIDTYLAVYEICIQIVTVDIYVSVVENIPCTWNPTW